MKFFNQEYKDFLGYYFTRRTLGGLGGGLLFLVLVAVLMRFGVLGNYLPYILFVFFGIFLVITLVFSILEIKKFFSGLPPSTKEGRSTVTRTLTWIVPLLLIGYAFFIWIKFYF